MDARLAAALAHCSPPLPVGVAFSGGADSTALLVHAARLWPGQVRALHVNHGLQAAADTFERHCLHVCERWGVPLDVARIDARHAAGESPEDAARQARYLSLAQVATSHGLRAVLLAQHADDQVETLLLALSRGAGLPGLAAMPARFERHGLPFLRPWLEVPGSELRASLAREGIVAVDDPTNHDTRFTRNRIRHRVIPALAEAFPQYRETFARSARHAAQAQALLAEIAAADLAAMQGEPRLAALQALSRARQANLLRHWLDVRHGARASTAQLDELLEQVACCTTRGHRVHLRVGRGFVQRREDLLAWSPSV